MMRAMPALAQRAMCCRVMVRGQATRFSALSRSQAVKCSGPSGTEPTSADSLYKHPELYKHAFSMRNQKAEVDFLLDVCERYLGRSKPYSVLELGCGPAGHSIELAARGCNVWALDNSEEMLEFAAREAQEAGSRVSLLQGDMRNVQECSPFDESSTAPPNDMDLAFCLLGSFSHMLTNQAALDCLSNVAQKLQHSGLLVLEMAQLETLFDGSFGTSERWEVELEGEQLVIVNWGGEEDVFDPLQQVVLRQVTVTLLQGEDMLLQTDERVLLRQYTANEVDLLARLTGFKVVGMFGEMDMDIGPEHEDAYRLVVVLQKQSS